MAAFIPRFLRQLRDVTITDPQEDDRLVYDADAGEWINASASAGSGAPTDATYLVTTAHDDLDAEVVVGATPGGELGGTWASPTVDATHSGSSHAGVQAAAEATAAGALAAHEADTTSVHGIADTSALALTANAVMDGDAAGGVLGGTYPNPSFAADMATQAELDAHLNDTSDAHDASAISIADAGNDFTATDVEGALAELQSDHETDAQNLSDHIGDTSDAHDASAISVLDTGTFYTATDVEGVLAEIAPQLGAGGSSDGWTDDSATTWTYASATTFTIAGVDAREKFSKGTRLKLTQTTVKYFVVVASSFSTDTTVTITGGTDYTLANAAITDNHYSYAVNPQGYPDWFSYTPTWASSGTQPAIVNGSLSGRFKVTGRTCQVKANVTAGGSTTFGTGAYTLSFPVTQASGVASPPGASLFFDSSTGAFYSCFWRSESLYSPAQPAAFLGPTVPVTMATSDQIQAHCIYEI